jgi:hypothetical protein
VLLWAIFGFTPRVKQIGEMWVKTMVLLIPHAGKVTAKIAKEFAISEFCSLPSSTW